MQQYLDLLRHVLENGIERADRTGTGTRSVFGHQMRFDLQAGFPLVTTKKTWFYGLAHEMLWFLSGSTNILPLVEKGISIWSDWPARHYFEAHGLEADPHADGWRARVKAFEGKLLKGEIDPAWGELGPVYGKQWRRWLAPDGQEIDQIARLVEGIRTNPDSRRHLVNAWNVVDLGAMALPPCHLFFQFYVGGSRLSCHLYVRSNDLFLGAPFNIAQYALLTHLVAQQCDLEVGELVYTIGDAHVYNTHFEQVAEQLTRTPYPLPTLVLKRRPPSIFDYRFDDFELLNYRHHEAIRAPVAV